MKEYIYHCNKCNLDFESAKRAPLRCPLCNSINWEKKVSPKTKIEERDYLTKEQKLTPDTGGINYKAKCLQCGHEWEPRVLNPKACPACTSYIWNRERKHTKIKAVSKVAVIEEDDALKRLEEAARIADEKRKEIMEAVNNSVPPMPQVPEPEKPEASKASVMPQVTKKFTKRSIMLTLAGTMVMFGILGFVIYFLTQNLVLGVPGVLLGIAGVALFKYYWDKGGDIQVEYHGEVSKEQVNCLNIYKDILLFENLQSTNGEKPQGYLWECLNDHKKYWINFSEGKKAEGLALAPFVLPDQQYYDPQVFAERVIELPAHRRIFRRREKLGQVIKTALLVVTVIILWVLIITTTGG